MKNKIILLMFVLYVNVFGGVYSHVYKFNAPSIENLKDGKYLVKMDNTISNDGKVGEPILPMREAKILIPSTDEVVSIEVIPSEAIFMDGEYVLAYATTLYPYNYKGIKKKDKPSSSIYSQDSYYPYKTRTKEDIQYLHGNKIIEINLFPVAFNPVQKKIKHYRQMKVVIKTQKRQAKNVKLPFQRNLSSDREQVLSIIDNKEDFNEIKPRSINARTKREKKVAHATREYVIITTSAMKESFQVLANHRQTTAGGGYTTYIEDVDNIMLHYSGVDRAEKVRNFIKDMYQNYGTKYILLGGDADGEMENHLVPMRSVYTKEEAKVPTDLYYGCLDGTWNSDHDNRWGESTDGENGGDIDWLSEVYVGRIAADNATEASNQIYKIITYETQKHTDRTLLMGKLMLSFYPTFGGDDTDWIYASQKYPIPYDTFYSRDYNRNVWSAREQIKKLNSNKYNWIIAKEHGSVYGTIVNHDEIEDLSNTKYFFLNTQGCHSGAIDYDDTVIERLTNSTRNGAFAAIANSRNGYGSSHNLNNASNIPQRRFTDAIFDGCTLGEANQRSRKMGNRVIAFEINLIGCPATHLINESKENKSKITYPKEGQVIQSDTLNIQWKNNGADKYKLMIHIQDSNNTWIVHSEFVYGTNKIITIPEDFQRGYIELDSYKNEKYLGHSEVHIKSVNIVNASKSVITDINFTRSSNKLAMKWDNHGADKNILSIHARNLSASNYSGRKWKKIYYGLVEENNKIVTIPAIYTDVGIRLISYQGTKLLGSIRKKITPLASVITSHTNGEKVYAGETITLAWENHGVSNETLIIVNYDSKYHSFPTIQKTVHGSSYTFTLPSDAEGRMKIWLSGVLDGRSATSIPIFLKILGQKSLIISPITGTKVKAGEDMTIEWENHGATGEILNVFYLPKGQYKYKDIYNGSVTGSNKTVTIPSDAGTNVIILLKSRQVNGNYERDELALEIEEDKVTIPAIPIKLQGINCQQTTATLSWTDKSSNEQGFKIYRGSTYVGQVGKNITSYPLKDLKAGTSYTYKVKAYNSAGESSAISTNFITKPDIVKLPVITNPNPTNSSIVNKSSTGQLLRVKVQNATSGIIYYDDDSRIDYHKQGTIRTVGNEKYLEVTIPYSVGKMKSNGKNYWYVIAKNTKGSARYPTSGNMSFTVKGDILVKPKAPSNLTVTNMTKSSVTLTWRDNSNNEQGFEIYRGEKFLVKVGSVNENVTSYLLKNLKENIIYKYNVRVYNKVGNSSFVGVRFKIGRDEQKSIILSPSNNTKVLPESTVTVKWENHNATRKYFYAYTKVNGKTRDLKYSYNIQGTSTSFKMPKEFTSATVYIQSYNVRNKYLGVSMIKLYPKTPSKPNAPTNLKAIKIEKNTATLTWKDNANNETGFKVYKGSTLIKTLGANAKSYKLTGLTANTNYTYSVKAYNTAGESSTVSTSFKTLGNVVVSKSIFTSPANGTKVKAGEHVTISWENHGAWERYLYAYYYLNKKSKYILQETVKGANSKEIIIPSNARGNVYIYLWSKAGSKYLGTDGIVLRVVGNEPSVPDNL